uniref:Uncharacterized protein n=1 Tax=Physcomitrium patens TaxID=3218 RepID=A0A2K1K7G2_PHYPA|nr:hypothetical protein PHYPA_011616 [Physcomitrium patens]
MSCVKPVICDAIHHIVHKKSIQNGISIDHLITKITILKLDFEIVNVQLHA